MRNLADNDHQFRSTLMGMMSSISDQISSINERLSKLESNDMQSKNPSITSKQLIRKKNIDECIEMMDWERIHKVMEYLDWGWCSEIQDGKMGVPSVESLITQARSDLERCFEAMDKYNNENLDDQTDSYFIYSGGIKVRTFTDNNCEIYFILSDYSTCE